jgi:DNA-binding NtrC family response regulator
LSEAFRFGRLWGRSQKMQAVFARLREIAETDSPVIIEGETGTGKELVGEALHDHSRRADKPYVVVDCGAIPEELIESELFGHVRGAFTGALVDRTGAFESADGGTIFIDELGELPISLQPRLLRLLEQREVKPVGGNTTKSIDVRILAATNRNLRKEIAEGRFREDLYFRLNVIEVSIPPLRERGDDVLFLAEQFLKEIPSMGGAPLELKADARERLLAYPWPGNVRELRNLIDRGAAMSDRYFRIPDDFGQAAELDEEDRLVPPPVASPITTFLTKPLWHGKTYKDAKSAVMADFERGYILALLEEHKGNVSAAARAAGIHRNILHRMMARYGIGRE